MYMLYKYEIFHDNFTYLKYGIKLDFSCKLHGERHEIYMKYHTKIMHLSCRNFIHYDIIYSY